MSDDWQVFDKRSAPVIQELLVTLQKAGNFSINQAAFNALGQPEVLEYLYNEKQQKVGFRKGDPAAPHVYPVRKQANSLNYQFSGIAFTKAYGIPHGTSRRFKARMEGDVLVIDLKHPLGEVSRDRTRRREK
jgi:hypothetical protein